MNRTVFAALLCACSLAHAQWSTSPDAGLQVTPAGFYENFALAAATDGGVWVAYAGRDPAGSAFTVYAQRYLDTGVPGLAAPALLASGTNNSATYHHLCAVAAPDDGLWVVWNAWEPASPLHAQLLGPAGQLKWTPADGGVLFCFER